MKKVLVLMAIVMFCLAGCITSTGDAIQEKFQLTDDAILAKTDLVYEVVRAIIVDPEVLPLIDANTLEHLKNIEKLYLFARAKHLEGDQMDTSIIDVLIACSDELVCIMDVLPGVSKYAERIERAKTAIRILRVMLAPVDASV